MGATTETEWMEHELNELQAFSDKGNEIVSKAGAERADQNEKFQQLMAAATERSQLQQIKSYQSSAASMGKLLGAGIKTQALIMIPFEIAEATKEFARFLSTGDPMALASSLEHALAVKQYAEAAGASGGGGSHGGSGGGGGQKAAGPESTKTEPQRTGTIIIEGARRDPHEQITLTGEQLYQIVDGINSKWREGSIILDFAR